MLKSILAIFIVCYPYIVLSQEVIQGNIIDKETRAAVAGALVYIPNSIVKTSSNASGEFTLKDSRFYRYDLVISAMGYEVTSVKIEKENQLLIELVRKNIYIDEVAVSPFMKDGWEIWGKDFTQSFIGTSSFAKHTKILNPEVVKFRYNKEGEILQAIANEPIQIENRALGYIIYYDLQNFELNMKDKLLAYEGSMHFESVARPSNRILANRKKVYEASFMRFVRSTFLKNWNKDGYEVREYLAQANLARKAADSTLHIITKEKEYGGDATKYWHKKGEQERNRLLELLSQPKEIIKRDRVLNETDLMTFQNNQDYSKTISYYGAIEVTNKNIKPEGNYIWETKKTTNSSQLIIFSPNQLIEIDRFGGYLPVKQWGLQGYFGWFTKIATLLPLDYEP